MEIEGGAREADPDEIREAIADGWTVVLNKLYGFVATRTVLCSSVTSSSS
jgi:hypothetical protein